MYYRTSNNVNTLNYTQFIKKIMLIHQLNNDK